MGVHALRREAVVLEATLARWKGRTVPCGADRRVAVVSGHRCYCRYRLPDSGRGAKSSSIRVATA